LNLAPEKILSTLRGLGYATFETEVAYDLNIFGIRTNSITVNEFNDYVGCVYRDEELNWHCEIWPATTDPGLYWLQNPSKLDGTAVLVPGQYRGVYKKDYHSGKYLALCQRNGPVKVWRDGDKDSKIETGGKIYEGMFGINIHHASYTGTSTQVNKWSAGCQVIANIDDFNRLMHLVDKQLEHHPTWLKFTYTLITENDLGGL
tara:strand:+ start:1164 stop:1772 length:609 start_codon:yes stop_codon:yes gene_type:complete